MGTNCQSAPHFIHVQPSAKAYESSTTAALNMMDGAVRQLASDPKLYLTKELGRKVQDLADKTALLKLDKTLMKGATDGWRTRFPERQLVTEQQAFLETSEKLTDPGGQLIPRFSMNMARGGVDCTSDRCARDELNNKKRIGVGWTDSAMRSAQAWANHELSGLNSELQPLVQSSENRTAQYLDWLGITDRYRNYRSNLGYLGTAMRSGPLKPDCTITTSTRPEQAPRWHLPVEWERAEAVGTQFYNTSFDDGFAEKRISGCPYKSDYVYTDVNLERAKSEEEAIKAAGVERRFPGKTEYQNEFILPLLHESQDSSSNPPPATQRHRLEQPVGLRGRGSLIGFDSTMVHTKGYPINPTPNYMSDTYTLSLDNNVSAEKMNQLSGVKKDISEMKDRYTWPRGEMIRNLFN